MTLKIIHSWYRNFDTSTGGITIWLFSTIWVLCLIGIQVLFHCKCIYTNNQLWKGMCIVEIAGILTGLVEIIYLAQESWEDDSASKTALLVFFLIDLIANVAFSIKFKVCPQSC